MGVLSTIKNNSDFSDAKTDAVIRNQILSRGRNRQGSAEERNAKKETLILTSFFKEVESSTESIPHQEQIQSNREKEIERQALDSTDLRNDQMSPELGTGLFQEPERDPQLLKGELSEPLLERKFRRLVEHWRDETLFISSSTEKMMHPSYQKIIGMGSAAVSLLLRELRERGGHWFWALRAITEEDPVSPEDVGRVRKMTEAWIQWGKQHNLL